MWNWVEILAKSSNIKAEDCHDGHMLQSVWMIKPQDKQIRIKRNDLLTFNWITAKKEFNVEKMTQNSRSFIVGVLCSACVLAPSVYFVYFPENPDHKYQWWCHAMNAILKFIPFSVSKCGLYCYCLPHTHAINFHCIFSGRKIQFTLITFNRN